jgi:hypothetical protein
VYEELPLPIEVELAKERMLQAQGALESYVQSCTHDIEQHKQLADALRMAINEFLDQLSTLLP